MEKTLPDLLKNVSHLWLFLSAGEFTPGLRSSPVRKREASSLHGAGQKCCPLAPALVRASLEQGSAVSEPRAQPFSDSCPLAWQAPAPPSHGDSGASPAGTSNYSNSMRY